MLKFQFLGWQAPHAPPPHSGAPPQFPQVRPPPQCPMIYQKLVTPTTLFLFGSLNETE